MELFLSVLCPYLLSGVQLDIGSDVCSLCIINVFLIMKVYNKAVKIKWFFFAMVDMHSDFLGPRVLASTDTARQ